MPIPEDELARVSECLDRYCAARVPAHAADRLRLKHRVDGLAVYIVESRPHFQHRTWWFDQDVAKFRYQAKDRTWHLYWADRNNKWHPDEYRRPAKRFETLLKHVDNDPTGIYWG
jgi:hypothetical protein